MRPCARSYGSARGMLSLKIINLRGAMLRTFFYPLLLLSLGCAVTSLPYYGAIAPPAPKEGAQGLRIAVVDFIDARPPKTLTKAQKRQLTRSSGEAAPFAQDSLWSVSGGDIYAL